MIEFPSNIILQDERVLLRSLQSSDFEWLLPYALNEPDTWDYSIISPAGEQGMRKYIADALAQREKEIEYPFIVFDKASGRYAGSTRFYDIQLYHLSTQLGFTWYGKEFRRTGVNRHCKWLLLSYAFETWGMERVEFRADARNERSIQAMKDIGCTIEGILRSQLTIERGGRRSSIILSILKEEWEAKVRENLSKMIK
jgi:RimJ/RimL family protein N-acetyltransferase